MTRGAAGKAGCGRLVERPARRAVQTERRWWIASDHHRHRFCTVVPGVQKTISKS